MKRIDTKKILIGIVFVFIVGTVVFFAASRGENNTGTNTASLIFIEDYKTFTHPKYGFSLEYPENLEVEEFAESDGGATIVFQKIGLPSEALAKEGFQIFISPIEQAGILTRERILEDLPSTVIEEPIEVVLGDGTHALLFWSEDSMMGKTREVWFSHNTNLYEITTYAHLDTWLAKILSSWVFNEL